MTYFLLTDSPRVALALREGLAFRPDSVQTLDDNGRYVAANEVIDRLVPRVRDPRQLFHTLETELSSLVADRAVVILVSGIDPHHLNPLENRGFSSLVAMLVLAFPEIRWFFGTILGYANADEKGKEERDEFRRAHGLINFFDGSFSQLLDPRGLRDWIRQCILSTEGCDGQAARLANGNAVEHPAGYLPRRLKFAVGLDEEYDYALLHAYAAYRFGFRALALSRRTSAEAVLGQDSRWAAPTVTFEDIYLNFPEGGAGYSDLAQRGKHFPKLESDQTRFRVLISSGHRPGKGGDHTRQANKDYIERQGRRNNAAGNYNPVHMPELRKPHSGVFRIWEDAGLTTRLKSGVAPGFVWPPKWPEEPAPGSLEDLPAPVSEGVKTGHSSPGVLLVIAQRLLQRAEALSENAHSVQKAVRGAVLAADALELLGGKTPTSSVAALALKQQFECLAVCHFSGVQHHFPMNSRIDEITVEAKSISHWFEPAHSLSARENAEIAVHSRLVKVFRDFNRFDEEQMSMHRIRHLHHNLWMRGERRSAALERPAESYEELRGHATIYWGKLRYILYPVLRYLEFCLASFPRFAAIILGWVFVIFVFFLISRDHTLPPVTALQDSLTSFFSIGGPIHQGGDDCLDLAMPRLYAWTECAAIVLGAFHLGVFVSHLYTLVSRK